MRKEYVVLCALKRLIGLIRTDKNYKPLRQAEWFKCLVSVTDYLSSAIESGTSSRVVLFYDLEDVVDLKPPKWVLGSLIFNQLFVAKP